jgi:hypothetical protein
LSQEENRDNENQNDEPVENDDNGIFKQGGLRARRIVETSLGDITNNNPTHTLFDNVNVPSNSDTDKNSKATTERRTKPEKDVGDS